MNEKQEDAGLDNFTRNYLYVLLAVVLIFFVGWLSSLDFRAGEINKLLKADPELAAYPYPFRVESLENGVAKVSSPRSARVSVIQSLRIIHPELQQYSAESEAMMAAQAELVRLQSHAGKLVKSQEDVKSVRWILDLTWLANHGVQVE